MTRTWFCDECGSVPGEQVEQEDSFFECKQCGGYVTLTVAPWPTEWEKEFERWLVELTAWWADHQDHGMKTADEAWDVLGKGREFLDRVPFDEEGADDDTD